MLKGSPIYTLKSTQQRVQVPAMAANPMRWFAPLLIRLFSIVEPLTPRAVSYYMGRYLRNWKNNNLILDYKIRTLRLGKLHYKIIVDLDLTPKQADRILSQQLLQALKRR
jgi:hypothetical protein